MITPTTHECAWAAGFFDGEGCVMIFRRTGQARDKAGRRYHRLIVSLRQADMRPLEWLMARWYGSCHPQQPATPNAKLSWTWMLSCRRAAAFLVDIQPYVVHKKERIAIALEFQATMGLNVARKRKGWTAVTPEQWQHREAMRQQLKVLNKRGVA